MARPKILFIGDILVQSGYGHASRLIIDDFQRFADVSCFILPQNQNPAHDIEKYKSLSTTKLSGFDGIITSTDMFHYWAHKKVALFWPHEFDQLPRIADKLSKCPLLLTYTKHVADMVKSAFGTNTKVYLPQMFAPPSMMGNMSNTFAFYNITADINPRKHVFESIFAYYWAFTNKDDVIFTIKIQKGIKEQFIKLLNDAVRSTTFCLRKDLPAINIDDNDYNDQQILMLHQKHDCYIGVSYGEGLSLPMYEAAKLNKPLIYNDLPPYKEYFLPYFPDGMIKSFKEISLHVAYNNNANFHPYTTEWSTSLLDLAEKMKYMYDKQIKIVNSYDWSVTDNTEEVVKAICSLD